MLMTDGCEAGSRSSGENHPAGIFVSFTSSGTVELIIIFWIIDVKLFGVNSDDWSC